MSETTTDDDGLTIAHMLGFEKGKDSAELIIARLNKENKQLKRDLSRYKINFSIIEELNHDMRQDLTAISKILTLNYQDKAEINHNE